MHALALALMPGAPPVDHLPPPYAYDTLRSWERLGLWRTARDVLLGQAGVSAEANWGFAASKTTWAQRLLKASTFLEKSGLTYDELRQLLDTSVIRGYVPTAGSPNPWLAETGTIVTCNLDRMTIKGLGGSDQPVITAWDRLHRFLRLRLRLGWTIDQTDYAVSVLDTGLTPIATDLLLRKLAVVKHFHENRGVPVEVVVSWFGRIDARRRGLDDKTSFYARVFQNPAVRHPPSSAFDLANAGGPATPTELADPNQDLGLHAQAIRGALGLSARDWALLTDAATTTALLGTSPKLPITAGGTGPSKMTLASLSRLHRMRIAHPNARIDEALSAEVVALRDADGAVHVEAVVRGR